MRLDEETVRLDEEDVGGMLAGALIGGGALNVIAVMLGGDSSWPLFGIGAGLGVPIGYRYADRLWRWWWLFWW